MTYQQSGAWGSLGSPEEHGLGEMQWVPQSPKSLHNDTDITYSPSLHAIHFHSGTDKRERHPSLRTLHTISNKQTNDTEQNNTTLIHLGIVDFVCCLVFFLYFVLHFSCTSPSLIFSVLLTMGISWYTKAWRGTGPAVVPTPTKIYTTKHCK